MSASTAADDPSAGKESCYSVVHAVVPVPPEKARYYNDTALEKRAVRATRARLGAQPTYLIRPPNLPRPRMQFYVEWEDVNKEIYQPILRPQPYEHLTDSELLANELWCLRTAAMLRRRVIDYMSAWERSCHHENIIHTVHQGHEVLLQKKILETRRPNAKVEPGPLPPRVATQKALNIPELLEAILRAATPETQLVAYSVSPKWRDVAT
jgi:hypothetical protein